MSYSLCCPKYVPAPLFLRCCRRLGRRRAVRRLSVRRRRLLARFVVEVRSSVAIVLGGHGRKSCRHRPLEG